MNTVLRINWLVTGIIKSDLMIQPSLELTEKGKFANVFIISPLTIVKNTFNPNKNVYWF